MQLHHHLQEMMEKYLVIQHEILDQIISFFHKNIKPYISHGFEYLLFQINPYWHHLFYYITISFLGYISLKGTKQSSSLASNPHHDLDLDLIFTSVSATTISSMSTVEMEDFTSTQLIVLVILMFSGGEVFLSLLGLQIRRLKHKRRARNHALNPNPTSEGEGIKSKTLRVLNHVVLGYILVSHILGYISVSLYMNIISSANNVHVIKKIDSHLFSIFVIVSTFANCGFIPINENMMPFNKNSGLLLILIPQILMGNKLYPSCLRVVIWVLEKFTGKEEYNYMLRNHDDLGYGNLISSFKAFLLSFTAIGLVMIQFLVFTTLEWNSLVFQGQNWYTKIVGSLFQTVNSRHSGESIVDVSLLQPATLALFVVMMYLPSTTIFVPIGYDKESTLLAENRQSKSSKKQKQESNILKNLTFSPLSYLAIFVMLICITEQSSLKQDPLNFTVFNIIVEVVSAYGNVGFSMGYSCKRRLDNFSNCKDSYYGFVGRWSWKGKFLLIFVMLFGRLKRFHFNSGNAWKLTF
ncbi:probable cation transporter HKT6 [Chenopodium quinoa]|uniref:probable cation transporter HKT6 n=1 Tax=Chenopodium quinoa TaxID=63459 RepID=UPI000B77D257|nr:probable cation transporter HKT6 [Chenopodium quinoa]